MVGEWSVSSKKFVKYSNWLVVLPALLIPLLIGLASPAQAINLNETTILNKNPSQSYSNLNTVKGFDNLSHNYFFSKVQSTLQSEITDPNFNRMRERDTGKVKAIFLVGGLIAIAVIVPVVTWWALSR